MDKEETSAGAIGSENDPIHSQAIQELLERTGYKIDKTSSCRIYGGPPPDFTGEEPSEECQVFIGRLPQTVKEDVIVPIFEVIGKIYVLRLIMEYKSDLSRGYAFLRYLTPADAERAIKELNDHEIQPGHRINVTKSEGNRRLYMGNITKEKTKDELLVELKGLFPKVVNVFVQEDLNDAKLNRGYAFVDFSDHKSAYEARRECATGNKILFGRQIRNVDWAEQHNHFTEEEINAVKSLHITPLSEEMTEEIIRKHFEPYGTIEKVVKIKDFAFVHMSTREEATKAKEEVSRTLEGTEIEVSFAKPQPNKKRKTSMRGGRGGRRGGRGRGGFYPPRFGYYDGDFDGYDYGFEMYGGGYHGDGYYGNHEQNQGRGARGSAGVWVTKRRKVNDDQQNEKWSDPSVTDQVGGNSGENWW